MRDFYAQLFGWTLGAGMGDYQGLVTDGEQPWAGILPADAASAGRWIPELQSAESEGLAEPPEYGPARDEHNVIE